MGSCGVDRFPRSQRATGFVVGDEIRDCAADVDAESVSHGDNSGAVAGLVEMGDGVISGLFNEP